MRSARETFAPPRPSKSALTCSRAVSTVASSSASLDAQPRCGSRRMRAPFAPPRLSVPRKLAAEAHAVRTSCCTVRPVPRTASLRPATSCVRHELVVDGRHGVLPQLGLRDPRAEVALDGAHVAVEQLVPGLAEGQRERVGVLEEAARDLLVLGVEAQREVGRQHGRRAAERAVLRVGHGVRARAVLGLPLVRAGRALRQLPLEAEEVLEELVAPPRRVSGSTSPRGRS